MQSAGRLDRRLRLLRAHKSANAFNEPIVDWRELANVAASYRPTGARERLQAGEVAATIDAVFRIRWARAWADFSPADRVRFEGRLFNVVGVAEVGRKEFLEISAIARAEPTAGRP